MTPPVRAYLSFLVAVLAINWAVAARLKRHRGLLTAIGTCDGGSLSLVCPILACRTLLILLCLAARRATLRHRIPAHLEEFLIFTRKREFLAAVGAGQQKISNHESLSSTL